MRSLVLLLALGGAPALAAEALSEVHVQVCGTTSARVVAAFGGDVARPSESRDVYFLDDEQHRFFGAGLIVRATSPRGDDKVELDVKLRPFAVDRLPAQWVGARGLKCETDVAPARTEPACRLRDKSNVGVLTEVLRGASPARALVNARQLTFVADILGADADRWVALGSFGPAHVRRWEVTDATSAAEAAEIEDWALDGETPVVELSLRVDDADAQAALGRLERALESRGLAPCDAQRPKTQFVLQRGKWHPGPR